jgi:hypothetical protein
MMLMVYLLTVSCQRPVEPAFDNPYDEQSQNYIPFASLATITATAVTAISAVSGGSFTNDYGKPVTLKGSCWSLLSKPTLDDSCSQDGSGLDPFTSILSELVADTTYHVRAYATNADGVTYGDEKSFRTLTGRPTVGMASTSDITALSATISLQVTEDGGAPISDRGLCWRLINSPVSEQYCISSGEGIGSVQHVLNNLNAGTKYYAYGYATNQVTTVYGSETEFLTRDGVIVFGTLSINEVSINGAKFGITIQDDGGATITNRGICYGLTENPDLDDSCIQNGEGVGIYSVDLSNLQSGTTYYVRGYATNQIGTWFGDQMTFTTGTTPPSVQTSLISQVTTTSATISGEVTNQGSASVTNRGVCYSINQLPTLTDSCLQSGNGLGRFTVTLNNLEPGRSYYVRSYAVSTVASVYGEQLSFTTGTSLPTVTTDEITNVLANRATISGTITDSGTSAVTTRGVCVSTDQNPTIDNRCVTAGGGTGNFTVVVTLLSSGTRYYARAFATSNIGTSYGNELFFVTGTTPPEVTTGSVSNVTTNSAQVSGNVISAGSSSVTTRGICYSKTQNPTTDASCVNSGSGTGSFAASLTSLDSGTLYYARAFASSSVGTSYGSQITFTTTSLTPPSVSTGTVTNITSGSAIVSGTVTNSGSSSVTTRGVCYSTSQNPTTSNSCVNSGSGTGSFSVNISGLRASTTYYVRAFASNGDGTAYGEQISFSTLSLSSNHNWTFVSNFPDDIVSGNSHGIVVDNNYKVWNAPYFSILINNDSERINQVHIYDENGVELDFSPLIGVTTGDSLLRFGPITGINKGADGNIYITSHGFRHTATSSGSMIGGVWNSSKSYIHVINPNTGQSLKVVDITRMRTETAAHAPNRPAVTADGYVAISYVFPASPIIILDPSNNWRVINIVTTDKTGFSRTLEISADGKRIYNPNTDTYTEGGAPGHIQVLEADNIFSPFRLSTPLAIGTDPGAISRFPNSDLIYFSGSGTGNAPLSGSLYEANRYYGMNVNTKEITSTFDWNYGSETTYRIPRGIAFSPDGQYVYVSSFSNGTKIIQKFRRN